jgi:hypothetical protein
MVLNMVRVTDALPIVSSIAWEDVLYAPNLLLRVSSLDTSLVEHRDFTDGCQSGYEGYFEVLWDDDVSDDGSVFVWKAYPLSEVLTEIHIALLDVFSVIFAPKKSFPWMVGYMVGWLSALSKYQPIEADFGMQVLASLSSGMTSHRKLYGIRPRFFRG